MAKTATKGANAKTVDLAGVRRADARLARAKQIDPNITARPVPIGELVATGRVTLTVPELATLTDLNPLTIRRAIASGELQAANGGGRSHYRISRTDAETWWRRRGGGTLLGAAPLGDAATGQPANGSVPNTGTPEARAAAILAGLDSDDPTTRNAAIVALAKADAPTSELVEEEVSRAVADYDGPEDDLSDWQALDSEPFHFPEESGKKAEGTPR